MCNNNTNLPFLFSIGSHKWLLQCQYLQGAPYTYHLQQPDHWGEEPHQHSYPRKAAGTNGHVLHQHLLHFRSRSQPPVWLQPTFRARHGQQLHRVMRAGVSARISERLQLIYRHAMRQQRQQLQQARRLRAVWQRQQGISLFFFPLFSVLLTELRPHPALTEAHANPCLTTRDGGNSTWVQQADRIVKFWKDQLPGAHKMTVVLCVFSGRLEMPWMAWL